jgi:hypothetical protein
MGTSVSEAAVRAEAFLTIGPRRPAAPAAGPS